MLQWLFKRPAPTGQRAISGYTADVMAARASFLGGSPGRAELTGTVQPV